MLTSELIAGLEVLTGNQGLINSLRVKAEHALAALDAAELTEVGNALTALRNQVQAQSDKSCSRRSRPTRSPLRSI